VSETNTVIQRLVAICLLFAAVIFFSPVMEQAGFPAFSILNGFLGASLQALAFLVIGVLASSIVQVFVSDDVLRRIFPSSLPGSIAVALGLSLVLPVCDCSSIPLFRSLVIRKVPLPAAVAFLLAAPVANPLVVWSTYFAFNGDWHIVLARVLMGLVVSSVVALSLLVHPPRHVLSASSPTSVSSQASAVQQGQGEGSSQLFAQASLSQKLVGCLDHARSDFFDIARYLVVGIALASIFKNVNAAYSLVDFSGMSLAVGIVVMMLAAFVLSLCSSSDAVVGRIFAAQLPTAPVLSFLVFGPMMDIKNVLMLSAHFSRGFIVRVALSAFAATGLLTGVLAAVGVIA
jgi:uncharacterized membrane protein YraQ (UPF0718 family)